MPAQISINPVRTPDDLADVAALFRAYAASLDVDLAYQDFADELAGLPGRYAPPMGALLIARNGEGAPLGCIALRPMKNPACCEMKRLFVAPAGRGLGLGRRLADALIAVAKELGYREMWLDTLPSMAAAQSLYRTMGFVVVDPYYASPVAGTLFMRRMLAD
ncbi:GNAT family N-acetyltransferase [Sphingomonas colocasiae]|uniref:GNAT family N-acetyltransferase n=1 Tax=Sphingomonas colocasiae TaxID=1848973 RepID=A0ABS7PXT9_9SPHN|nr:GNAT family N-acetyltransferase [Sphingomonas colocasiae]MBY8826164.1 GNAT family N-acetyltransferase [Sphingomonas colocasiae]